MLLILEKTVLLLVLEKLPAFVGHVYTCLCFVMGWVLFAITDFGALGRYVSAMFTAPPADAAFGYLLRSNAVLLILAGVGCTMLPVKVWQKLEGRVSDSAGVWLRTAGVTVILLLSIAFLVGDSYNPFLYFRF